MANSKVIFGKSLQIDEKTSIFEGLYKLTEQKIIIKQYRFHEISQLAQGLQELICQAKLHHPRFCSLVDALFTESAAGYELSLYLERLDGDLQKEIESRAIQGKTYSEQELWEFLQGTVEALALAQDLSICHRDIKPANIFVGGAGEYKIGDFGAAKMSSPQPAINTLQGTFAYMSPELRAAYTSDQRPEYNPFTSDVYSLGMTWLSMAVLHVFTSSDMQDLVVVNEEEWQDRMIADLHYSEDLKIVLKGMLTYDARHRPDFRELNSRLKEQQSRESGLEATESLWSFETSEGRLQRLLGRLLAEKWGAVSALSCPTVYLKQLEVVEQLSKLSSEAALKAAKYEFPYIPLSQVLSDFTDEASPVLLIRQAQATGPPTQITAPCSAFKPQGSHLIVRKQHQIATISEPAVSEPSISVKLRPHQPRYLLDSQIFRFGKAAKMYVLAATQSLLTLQVCVGTECKQYSYTPEQSPIRIGRCYGSNVWLLVETVSLNHAEIAWNGTWRLQDLGSSNGTWVFCHSFLDCDRESNEERLEDGTEASDSAGRYIFGID